MRGTKLFGIIDFYIIKKFLGTFFYSIVLIISIVIVFDISEKLDDFIEKNVSLYEIVVKYYLNFAPYYINLFMFLFIFISVIFFTSKLASHTEIIAILSSGVSFNRLLFPYFMSALFLGLLSFGLNSFVIPPATKVRLDFENKYINGTFYNKDRNIHKQIEPGVFVYLESYNTTTDIAYKFSMEKFVDKNLVSKMMCDYVKWDSITRRWTATNYYIRHLGEFQDKIEKGKTLDTAIKMEPKYFKQRVTMVETLNMPQLNSFIEEQKMHGIENMEIFLIEKYKRIAFPFSTFILTLIGVALSSRKVRGGTGMHIGFGLMISALYLLFMQISSQFAISGTMSPMLAVWVPNIVFSFVAIGLYITAPK